MRRWRAAAAIRADNRSGATALAARAGAALRDLAAEGEGAGRLDTALLATAARELVRAQPAMAAICRLAAAVLARAGERPTAAVVAEAVADFEARVAADAAATVARAALLCEDDAAVLTLSASSLVERALLAVHHAGRPLRAICLESRPGREGAALARRLAAAGIPAELWVDAAAARCLQTARLVLLGADTVAPAGLVHKLGTLGLALAAREQSVPVYALAGPSKMLPALVAGALAQRRPAAEVLRGPAHGLTVQNYYYDLTPLTFLSGVIVGAELLSPDQATAAAASVPLHPLLAPELLPPTAQFPLPLGEG